MLPSALFLMLWFTTSFLLSFAGILEHLPPAALGISGLLIPSVGFALLYTFSPGFRRFFRKRSLRVLTWGQNFRLYGILALFMTYNHVLPAAFAIPTAIIDIVFALSSIIVAK